MQFVAIGSPIGALRVVFDEQGVSRVLFEGEVLPEGAVEADPDAAPWSLVVRFRRYFGGLLGALDAIPAAVSGSPFQSAAWAAVRAVPAGEVVTYQQLADRLGHPNGARAIGRAMATNLTPILIPCHRVVAGDGSLAGYRGGATRKRWLLAHEAGQSSLF